MKSIRSLVTKRLYLVLFLAVYLIVGFLTFTDFGASLDEYFVYKRGKAFYQHVRIDDPLVDLSFTEKYYADDGETIDNSNHLFKNSTYPAFLYVFNEAEDIDVYHLVNIIFASIAFIAVYEILLLAGLSPIQALLGPILLLLTPRFTGHIPFNAKDMPYTVTYIGTLLIMLHYRKLPRWLGIILLGGAIGITTSIRQVGFLLLPLFALFWLYYQKIRTSPIKTKLLKSLALDLLIMFAIVFGILLFTYPYLIDEPVSRFIELLAINQEFPWNETILLFGKEYLPSDRPWTYLPIWLLITTPLFITGFALVGMRKIMRNEVTILIGLSLFINFAIYIILNPTIYDGVRHFMYLLPHIVILATIGFHSLWTTDRSNKILTLVLGLHIGLILFQYVTLHPYQYTYFNELVGGLHGAQNDFERDYWGTSDKEAMLWLHEYLRDNRIDNARISTCSRSASIEYYLPQYTDANNAVNFANYFVCYGRFDSLEEIHGEILYTVERQGVTLNTVVHVNTCHL